MPGIDGKVKTKWGKQLMSDFGSQEALKEPGECDLPAPHISVNKILLYSIYYPGAVLVCTHGHYYSTTLVQ